MEPYMSKHNCPLVVVIKKVDTSPRICLDLRMLNNHILPDRWAIPAITDVIRNLNNMNVFSSIDLLSGFYHISVDEESRDYFSFATPNGAYRLTRLPMGLSASTSVFSKVMNLAIGHLQNALIFI